MDRCSRVSSVALMSLPSRCLAALSFAGRRTDGHPILFLHGLFGNKKNWRSIARQVNARSGRTTFALDLRNHGDSPHSDPQTSGIGIMAADVRHFLADKDLSGCLLVGHSLGGRVALKFAFLYPDLVEKVVAVDVSPLAMPASVGDLARYADAMTRAIVEVRSEDPLAVARKSVDRSLAPDVQEKFIRDFLLLNLCKDGEQLSWKFNLPTLRQMIVSGELRRPVANEGSSCERPCIFIYGRKSDFVRDSDLPKILELAPHSTFHGIPDAGHYLHVEKQTEFLRLLLSHVD